MKQVSSGFSLVEILVAMVISLLGTIIIFQVFEVSEGIKRTTNSGGDAQQNGLLALIAVERDARMAGFGINYGPLLGCTVQGQQATRPFTFKLAAAEIGDGASSAGDSLTFVFGSSDLLLTPPKLVAGAANTATIFQVDNRFGFGLNDLIVAGQVGRACSLAQATNLPTATGQKSEVHRNSGDYNTGNMAAAYDAWDNTSQSGGRLYTLGPAPAAITYSVDSASGQLMAINAIRSGTSDVIAENIVQLQAEYGKDTSGTADGQVDVWDTTAPITADGWARVLALRIAIVARSALPEKAGADGLCRDINDPTDPAKLVTDPTRRLKWAGGGINLTYLTTAQADWTCYRYRVFETLVPLRNQIWTQP